MELRAMPWHESIIEAELARARVLVNATSVGLADDLSPIPAELLPSDLLVLDLIYNPPQTRLLRDAAAAGCATQNGELMLLHQGAAAFTLWTGQPAPVELMRETLESGLAAAAADVGSAAEPSDPGAG
jgi:shikimate dehydrogenase